MENAPTMFQALYYIHLISSHKIPMTLALLSFTVGKKWEFREVRRPIQDVAVDN